MMGQKWVPLPTPTKHKETNKCLPSNITITTVATLPSSESRRGFAIVEAPKQTLLFRKAKAPEEPSQTFTTQGPPKPMAPILLWGPIGPSNRTATIGDRDRGTGSLLPRRAQATGPNATCPSCFPNSSTGFKGCKPARPKCRDWERRYTSGRRRLGQERRNAAVPSYVARSIPSAAPL
jgi:hypothetical protein